MEAFAHLRRAKRQRSSARFQVQGDSLNPHPYIEMDVLDIGGGNCSDCGSALREVVKMINVLRRAKRPEVERNRRLRDCEAFVLRKKRSCN